MLLFLLLAALAIGPLPASASTAGQKPARTNPVLVELFTSEGCSSCPPADALLSRLQREQPVPGAQIIVLGEHVDYWDGLGWRDRFSSPRWTARQNAYGFRFRLDSVYTPQMVVDGRAQFVGNDQARAWRAVAEAARSMKLPLALAAPGLDGRTFTSTVSLSAPASTLAKPIAQGDLYAALVDPMDSSAVRHGENSGRTLQHVAVVRTLTRIGGTKDLARGAYSFRLTAPEGADLNTMQLVVFAQQEGSGPILGAVMSEGRATALVTSTTPR